MRVTLDWLRQNYAGDLDAVLATQQPARRTLEPVAGQPSLVRLDASEGRWEVEIADWRPASDNVRAKGVRPWCRAKRRDKSVLASLLSGHVPAATGKRRISLRVVKRRKPLPDPSNLWKSFLDALVAGGFLRGDSGQWCRTEAPEVDADRNLPCSVVTILTLEDL